MLTLIQCFRRLGHYASAFPDPGLRCEAHPNSATGKDEEGRNFLDNMYSRTDECFQTDDRVQVVTESAYTKYNLRHKCLWAVKAMNVIRMIKLFGWEPKMNKQIAEKRDEELKWIKLRQILDMSNGTIKCVLHNPTSA